MIFIGNITVFLMGFFLGVLLMRFLWLRQVGGEKFGRPGGGGPDAGGATWVWVSAVKASYLFKLAISLVTRPSELFQAFSIKLFNSNRALVWSSVLLAALSVFLYALSLFFTGPIASVLLLLANLYVVMIGAYEAFLSVKSLVLHTQDLVKCLSLERLSVSVTETITETVSA